MTLLVRLFRDIAACMASLLWQSKLSMCRTSSSSSCFLLWRVALPSIWSPWSVHGCYPCITHPQTWPLYLWCSQINFSFPDSCESLKLASPSPSPTLFVLLITPSLSQLVSSFIFLKPTCNLVESLLKTPQWLSTVLQVKSRFLLWVMVPLCDLVLAHPFNLTLCHSLNCPSSQAHHASHM